MNVKFWRSTPKVGSAENPEIIDSRLPRPTPGRLRFVLQIFIWLVMVSLPAVFFDLIWIGLFRSGMQQGDGLAWVLLILCSPPAFLFTVFALIADLFLSFLLVLTLMGKSIQIHNARFARFTPPPQNRHSN